MNDKRLENEKTFHDKRFEDDTERTKVRKYYTIHSDASKHYHDTVSRYCNGKKLLEYGCGTGSSSENWLKLGALVTGIDISPQGIKKAKERFDGTSYRADYFVMNAEKTDFENDSFDVVVGTGIIHHLNLANSYQELNRILNRNGHAIFIEPLGHNPVINLYRMMTPNIRTEDEHPLTITDIKLLNQYFHNVEVKHFSLFTLLAVPMRNTSLFNAIHGTLRMLDNISFRVPFIKKYSWTAVIHASNPKK